MGQFREMSTGSYFKFNDKCIEQIGLLWTVFFHNIKTMSWYFMQIIIIRQILIS